MDGNYLFIDGEFFRRFLDEMKEVARSEGHDNMEIYLSLVGRRYDRVFFYDAYPERKKDQSESEFQLELENTKQYFSKVATTQNFSVRPALTSRSEKRRQQKGVDVLLAIECLTHALRNNIDQATIMTSDLDFYPLFEALLQTKTKSVLRYQISKTSTELVQAADFAHPLTFSDFNRWLPAEIRPVRGEIAISVPMPGLVNRVATGTIAGQSFELIEHKGNPPVFFIMIDGSPVGTGASLRAYVEGELERLMNASIKYDKP